jgi:O-antigen/teichoic acid export membrane protein
VTGSFREHLSAVTVSEIVARSAQFGVLALAARELAPSAFGIYGLAAVLHQLSLAIVQNGPELHATRLVAQQLGRREVVLRLAALKGALAAGAYLAIILIALAVYRDPALLRQVSVQGLLLPIAAVNMVWVLKAGSRFGLFAFARGGQAILFLGLVYIFLRRGPSPLAIPCAEAAATGMVVLLSLPFCLRLAGRGESTPRPKLLFPSLALGFSGLCAEAIWSAPVTIGGLFLDTGAVGLVAGVNRILTALNGIFQMLLQVFYPSLARRYAEDAASARNLTVSLLAWSAAAAVASIAIGSVFAEPLVRLLLGPAKLSAVPVLRLYLWALGPTFTGAILGFALLASGHHKIFTNLAIAATAMAFAGAALGYALAPEPRMAAVQVATQVLYTAALLIVTSRLGLVGSLRALRPSGLRQLLSQH